MSRPAGRARAGSEGVQAGALLQSAEESPISTNGRAAFLRLPSSGSWGNRTTLHESSLASSRALRTRSGSIPRVTAVGRGQPLVTGASGTSPVRPRFGRPVQRPSGLRTGVGRRRADVARAPRVAESDRVRPREGSGKAAHS